MKITSQSSTQSLMKCILSNDNLGLALTERSLTIQKAIQAPNVLMQIAEHGEKGVLQAVSTLLSVTASYFNTGGNLTSQQAMQIAALFISEYKQESVEDMALMLKKLKLGAYGKIFRIDGDTIFKCFNLYLDEKYAEFEKMKQNEKAMLNESINPIYLELAAEVLKQKEINENKPKTQVPIQLTDKGHFETFKVLIKDFTMEELADILDYYKKINMPVMSQVVLGAAITKGHFDHYIEVINAEIRARQ